MTKDGGAQGQFRGRAAILPGTCNLGKVGSENITRDCLSRGIHPARPRAKTGLVLSMAMAICGRSVLRHSEHEHRFTSTPRETTGWSMVRLCRANIGGLQSLSFPPHLIGSWCAIWPLRI